MFSEMRLLYRDVISNIYGRKIIKKGNNKNEINKRPVFIDNTVVYSIKYISLPVSYALHKWVGAQLFDGKIYFIPNDEKSILSIDDDVSYIGLLGESLFKWTGGCVWNNALYCFPRSSNCFLKLNFDESMEQIPLPYNYASEHHYSGVCTKDGIVYQPPRNTNHILKVDLSKNKINKIVIVPRFFKINFRYCGSIIHPNGYIYFFPENGYVIKLDIKTDKWCFIGKTVRSMCFDAKIGVDGNIYGYSAYSEGIMKIDVENDYVEMIHQEISPGAYGTKYGSDGCLYSVPGDGRYIYKYNVITDDVERIFDVGNENKAKYAGGITLENGDIVFVPATAKSILILKCADENHIPQVTYKEFCIDNY